MANLGYLVSRLRNVNFSRSQKLFKYESILKSYKSSDWNNFLNPKYINQFQKNLVHRDQQFEIYLINWPYEYAGGIHNHSENGCLLKILKGGLRENIYHTNLDLLESKEKYAPDISYLDDSIGYHSIRNINTTNSISLHIYSPTYHTTQYFDYN